MNTIIPLNYTLWNNPESVLMRIDLKGLLDSLGIDVVFGNYSEPWVYDPNKLTVSVVGKPIIIDGPKDVEYFTDTYDTDGYIGIKLNRIMDDYFDFDGEMEINFNFHDDSISGYYPDLKDGLSFVFQVRSSSVPFKKDNSVLNVGMVTFPGFNVSNIKTSIENADIQFQVTAYNGWDDVVRFKDISRIMQNTPSIGDNKTYELSYNDDTGNLDLAIKENGSTIFTTSTYFPSHDNRLDLSSQETQDTIKNLFEGYFAELGLSAQLDGYDLIVTMGDKSVNVDLSSMVSEDYNIGLNGNLLELSKGSEVIGTADLHILINNKETPSLDISALESKVNSLMSNHTRLHKLDYTDQLIKATLDDGNTTANILTDKYPIVTGFTEASVDENGQLCYFVSNKGTEQFIDLSKLLNPNYYATLDKANINTRNPSILLKIQSVPNGAPMPSVVDTIHGFEILDMINLANAKSKQFQTTNNLSLETSPYKPGIITLRDGFMNKTYDVNVLTLTPVRARTLKCKMFDPGCTMLTERKGDIVTVIFKQDNPNNSGFKFNQQTFVPRGEQIGEDEVFGKIYWAFLKIRNASANFVNVGYRPRFLATSNVRDEWGRLIGAIRVLNNGSISFALFGDDALNYYKKGRTIHIDQLTYVTNDQYPTQDTGTIE